MRVVACLLTLLLAAACVPAENPDSPLARAALGEWRAWGRLVIEGWPEARHPDTAATQDRFARILGYWSIVPDLPEAVPQLQARRAALSSVSSQDGSGAPTLPGTEDIADYAAPPWSAAFISAMARRAAVPEDVLPSTALHVRYVDAMLMRWQQDPGSAPFRPHAPADYAPKPGDLVCADRNMQSPLSHWTERLAELGRVRPMHCDIVVRARRGRVEAIGGNVRALVARRVFPTDAAGRLLPAPPDWPVFVLVLEAASPPS